MPINLPLHLAYIKNISVSWFLSQISQGTTKHTVTLTLNSCQDGQKLGPFTLRASIVVEFLGINGKFIPNAIKIL